MPHEMRKLMNLMESSDILNRTEVKELIADSVKSALPDAIVDINTGVSSYILVRFEGASERTTLKRCRDAGFVSRLFDSEANTEGWVIVVGTGN